MDVTGHNFLHRKSESKAIMSAFLIPCTPTLAAYTATEALVAAETVGFPVALKINSPDISHKSDVDGVRTNVIDAHDVRTTFKLLTENLSSTRPEARLLGVTVEPMVTAKDSRELMVGVKRDPVFGPARTAEPKNGRHRDLPRDPERRPTGGGKVQ